LNENAINTRQIGVIKEAIKEKTPSGEHVRLAVSLKNIFPIQAAGT